MAMVDLELEGNDEKRLFRLLKQLLFDHLYLLNLIISPVRVEIGNSVVRLAVGDSPVKLQIGDSPVRLQIHQ
jgi:hypothetical protein